MHLRVGHPSGGFCDALIRELLLKGKISTVDLLVLTSLDMLILYLKYYLPFFKTSYLNEEVNCTEPSLHLVFPALIFGQALGARTREH